MLFLDLVYLALIVVASPWLLFQAWRHGKYREGFAAKWLGQVPERANDRPCIWFHAVSVGEVNLLKPLLERCDRAFPGWECVVSTTTKTGYELARQKYADRIVFYCPLDFSWAVKTALRRIRPRLLVLAELELWPNLIRQAQQTGCRVAVVNGRLSEKSLGGYQRIRPLIRRVLQSLDLVAVQNQEYADRFQSLGVGPDRLFVTGSIKFDGVQIDRGNKLTVRLRELSAIAQDDIVFLAGSTQAPEESLAVETYRQLRQQYPQLRLILVPRHVTRSDEIAEMLNRSGIRWQRRTELDHRPLDPEARILLVDTIGELGGWWGTAQIAFVGGSLGSRGGQNMIEPAAYGAAVSFGPNTRNFRDIVRLLLDHDAAEVVDGGDQLTAFVRRCLEDPRQATQMGARAQQLVQSQQGAADRTIALLRTLAPPLAQLEAA